ncbi:MAG: hypothetical protein IPP69_00795 [Flavobacteriales bacterium]|nr:hypothetical protein [Flavobacteriales bacterium]
MQAFSQRGKFEKSKDIGLMAGTSYYIGEINPYKHFGTKLKPGGGIAFRNNFNRRWTLKTSLIYATVEAWDADSDDPWIRNRNLSFRNQVIEGSMVFELNFFNYQLGNDQFPVSPYLFGGLAYFNMRPMAQYKGTWYELQPLGTEGQGTEYGGDKYKTNMFSVPFGAGIKTNLFAVFGFSLEWGVRKTWTDYFDDISGKYVDPGLLADLNGPLAATLSDRSIERELPGNNGGNNAGLMRGDPGRKDFYVFCMASLNIRIDKKATSCWEHE